ncbi:FAD-dependent monooxygenase [Psittacicella gerlachiana]|uniref:FAD-binding domain-containing protein n=1 Tax=Psittacicella gerlachiana TaxID=2028574 RepID=A0A3A1YJ18_9GAMM|nr:FAD-dependent monooxygenase [Psittacicella gerlachiana]RIY36017.1 hypothetical protein CKF59_03075 [Psittacicella gerlachiana]
MLQEADITVVGTGLVGLSLTLDLLKQGYQVTLIGQPSIALPHPANRVVALNLASKEFLTALGVWDNLNAQDFTPYYAMKVWEKDENGYLEFTHKDVNQQVLGYNVINSALEQALWQSIQVFLENNPQSNLNYLEQKVVAYQALQSKHFLTLEDSSQILSTFLIAADGGNSFIRKALNIGVERHEYSQTAITCVLELPEAHNNTCYQSFHKNGILAYLPLAQKNQVSIVWSLNNNISDFALNLSPEEFCQQVYACFHKGLGVPKLISTPTSYPLAKQYAQSIAQDNLAIIGDAAHTIHPLAGQGVNLGFADAWRLADLIRDYYRYNQGIERAKLDSWARERKTKALLISESMAVIKHTFCNQNPLLRLARNTALNFVNKQDFVKKQLITQALGFHEKQYSQASFNQDLDLNKQKKASSDLRTQILEHSPAELAQNFLQKFFK